MTTTNTIRFRGSDHKFSKDNISGAVRAVTDFPLTEGLERTNEKVYDLITLGKSFEETIEGDKKSFTLKYIDWETPENNVFHVGEEVVFQRHGSTKNNRPDIVLYVNGFPLVIIECKRPDLSSSSGIKPYEQAISQHLRNQQEDQIPGLYIYAQLLLALDVNQAYYATAGTPLEFWSKWKEQNGSDRELKNTKQKPLENEIRQKLFEKKSSELRTYFENEDTSNHQITEQDKLLYALCRPERLINFIYKFILFDNGTKKAARYQQYFAVNNTLRRVRNLEGGKRKGGVIWHTQGSGKSLTMVMLAKSIALEKSIKNPRIVLVTDRVDLDDQIYKTFNACEMEPVQAKSGKHLIELISERKSAVITTLLQKFEAAVKKEQIADESPDIFVLVDESHRSQYGEANIRMQAVFPNACYIGFTGTPLMKKDKNTADKFGGIIDKYTIDEAVEDKAVVPLLYEGRHVVQQVQSKSIDDIFSMVAEPLEEYQKADLKKKFSRADHLNEADLKIYRTAWDVSLHFQNTWQNSGFKGQLTAPSKKAALKYKEYFDDIGIVKTEVLISSPDMREGYSDLYETPDDKVVTFWKNIIKKYGNERNYNKSIINAFKHDPEPEILIVVDKLLTGFDAPNNVVLYICRSLRDHTLLQAIARVNRLKEGKDHGYIIDYYGILGDLDKALTDYGSLSDFDEEDLECSLINISEEISKLKECHAQLWDIFKEVKHTKDTEAYARTLAPKDIRDDFYDRLSQYARTLKTALSTVYFNQNTPPEEIDTYKNDLKFFVNLRTSVRARYSDEVDYKKYEKQIQKLIDTHITADEIMKVTQQVNIFDVDAFQSEVERVEGKTAKADMIATRTSKTIAERMDEDPVLYKRFSRLLQETIDDFHDKRISEAEYLKSVTDIMNQVRNKTDQDTPEVLYDREEATAFYRVVGEIFPESVDEDQKAEAGIRLDDIIRANKVVDWKRKEDVINRMKQTIEDYLYDLRNEGIELSFEEMDEIIESVLNIAENRY